MTISHLKRRQEFDILKGLLIICVVMGHTAMGIPFVDVFWFHMPAFFMITGFLTRTWLSPADIFHAIKIKDKSIFSRVAKYLIPYFTYCFVFYLIFHTESVLKNLVRVLYAGSNNITVYSFPYWYINALFIGILMMGMCVTWKKMYQYGFIAVIWIFLHTGVIHLLPVPLPWGIDNALGSVVFLYIGYLAKDIAYKKWNLLFLLVPFMFVMLNKYTDLNYKINMMGMVYEHFILDIIVPLSFTYLLYRFSFLLKRIPLICNITAYLGHASITIYFIHAAILWIMRDNCDDSARIIVALAIGCTLHRLFEYFRITRIIFLGNMKMEIN